MIRSRTRFLAYALAVVAAVAVASPVVAEDGGSSEFIWPTSGRITQPFGCTGFYYEPRQGSCAHFHGGIDVASSRGTPIRAAAAGVITHVGWDQWGLRNWMVMIKHGGGFTTWYAHMRGKQIPGIRKGVRVRQGQLIGYMDRTGMATGVHLHWAVLKSGRYVNPRNYVQGQPQRVRRGAGSGAVGCDVIPTVGFSAGATAVVLETDSTSGGRDSCAA